MQTIRTRGRTFTGIVIRARMQNTATIEWDRRVDVPKFERYEKRKTRIQVHNPEDINAKEGDVVQIQECKPISKTKKFTIIKKLSHERLFEEKQSLMEESKKKQGEEHERS